MRGEDFLAAQAAITYMTTVVICRVLMRKIQLKDAKANLSAVVDQATRGKPSVITRHGKPEAVVLGFADWERLSRVPSFGRLLMSAPLEPEICRSATAPRCAMPGCDALSGRYQRHLGDRAHRGREARRA